MSKHITTLQRATALSSALLLIGLAGVIFTGRWWPWIMLVIGIPLAVRQYFLGRFYDMMLSIVIFGGVFATAQFNIAWNVILPVFFITAAIYILFREFIYNKPSYQEEEEDHNIEIEIESEEKKSKK